MNPAFTLDICGGIRASSAIQSKGNYCVEGINGTTHSNIFNTWWSGSGLQCWVNDTNLGNFTICDHRIKENIRPPTRVLDRLSGIPMISYELVESGIFKKNGTHIGFYAHDLQEAFPEYSNLVNGNKNEVNERGDIIPQTVNAELCHLLMKAIQEQTAIIKTLQKKVEIIEAQLGLYCLFK
jgi:hypothetical protein